MGFLNLTRLLTLIAMLVAALALPAAATADGDDVIRDCARDGDLDGEYSDEELEDASQNMPSDLDAYSSCREVIRRAQAGGRGSADGTGDTTGDGGATGGSGGGGAAGDGSNAGNEGSGGRRTTPSDIAEINRQQQEALSDTAPATPAELAAGADAGDDGGLPAAALVAIALLGLAAIAGGVYLLRDHLPPGLTSRLPGTSR
jgi:hypothetical protein